MKSGKFVIFTACSVNYLPKAVAMCRSVLDHNPNADLIILVADSPRHLVVHDDRVKVIWAEEIGFPDYFSCAFKYNIIEFNTALKPFFALQLLEHYSKVIYLDPDVCVFSSLESVLNDLGNFSTILTPHALTSYSGDGRPNDQDFLKFGVFNLGFFAVADSADAKKLLQWWHGKCLEKCYYEPQLGLGVDQKWMDLAPAFFNGICISKNEGLNLAFWNLHERRISNREGQWFVNDMTQLVFAHFSSFVENDRQIVADKQTRYKSGDRPDFSALADRYREYLTSAKGSVSVSDNSYRYAQFENGATITPALRRFYAISIGCRFSPDTNPFSVPGSVYSFARDHFLLTKAAPNVGHVNFKVTTKLEGKKRVIAWLFRMALRVLGPDRYFYLMRYLGMYTSLLHQGDIVK